LQKDRPKWSNFQSKNSKRFAQLKAYIKDSQLFEQSEANAVACDCYPLHPATTFIGPRLSEKIAQNERTLLTFLSTNDHGSLPSLLSKHDEGFLLITPDVLYDYFSNILSQSNEDSSEYKLWKLTETILEKLQSQPLQSKIIKTLSLIWLVEHFELLPPTKNTIENIFVIAGFSKQAIGSGLAELIESNAVIYLHESNGYLKLKQSSGVNIDDEIKRYNIKNTTPVTEILSRALSPNYLYPTRHNDDNSLTRYFDIIFVEAENLDVITSENYTGASGVIYIVVPTKNQKTNELKEQIAQLKLSKTVLIAIFNVADVDIHQIAKTYDALDNLRKLCREEDTVLQEEYRLRLEDIQTVLNCFLSVITQPNDTISFYHLGKKYQFQRRRELSNFLSTICDEVFINTPRIIQESINRDSLTKTTCASRLKIIEALLDNPIKRNFGFEGGGQEVAIARSVLVNTGILQNIESTPTINLTPPDQKIAKTLHVIRQFFSDRKKESTFAELYSTLTEASFGYGLKRGIIPIFIAVLLNGIKEHYVFRANGREVALEAELLDKINDNPSSYTVWQDEWSSNKADYLGKLGSIYQEFIPALSSKKTEAIVSGIHHWYLALPKYARQLKYRYTASQQIGLATAESRFISSLKYQEINPREYLFEILPTIANGGLRDFSEVGRFVEKTKILFDTALDNLIVGLNCEIKALFARTQTAESLYSVIINFLEGLSVKTQERLFDDDNTNTILRVFSEISPNEFDFIKKLAKAVIGLRVEDWDSETPQIFIDKLKQFKQAILSFDSTSQHHKVNTFEIIFTEQGGKVIKKHFEKRQLPPQANLLKNEISTALEEMGTAITLSEKRQTLMEVLEGLC